MAEQRAQSAENSPAQGSIASRTRRQTRMRPRGDDDGDEEKQFAQSSAHVSPAMRIYRHALESIFAMLELHDLIRVLVVSRSWSSAVRSMKPIGATFSRDEWQIRQRAELRPFPPFDSLLSSPLLRHLAAIDFWPDPDHPLSTPLTKETLALLAQYAPNLTSLDCSLTLTLSASWILPAKLTSLVLGFSVSSPPDINTLLVSVAALPALERFCLLLPNEFSADGVDLHLLAAAPSLADFTFECLNGGYLTLSDEQVNQIRTTFGHLQRIAVATMDHEGLGRFLPVTARWQDIDSVWLDARAEELLVTLPSLTKLYVLFDEDRPHLDFLSQLPQLKVLELWCKKRGEDMDEEDQRFRVPPAALLRSLLPCTGITELELQCGFSSAQLTTLFAKLTSLVKLHLVGDLESLLCFASGPITRSLEDLNLDTLALPPSELPHLYALSRLRVLYIDRCCSPRLDDSTIDSLSPPTAFLPALTELFHQWRIAEREYDSVERKGPSFEWMQARLTQ